MIYKSKQSDRFMLHQRRPIQLLFGGYCSTWSCRLRAALDVMRGKADALYWEKS